MADTCLPSTAETVADGGTCPPRSDKRGENPRTCPPSTAEIGADSDTCPPSTNKIAPGSDTCPTSAEIEINNKSNNNKNIKIMTTSDLWKQINPFLTRIQGQNPSLHPRPTRSEERRVGKECS